MFPTDEFLKGAMFGAVIGGIITVVLLKLWKKKGQRWERLELRKQSEKRPTEHDERF